MRLQTRMGHHLIMTPQLQQAIKLLQMSRVEMEQLVEQSLLENPVLEENDADTDSLENTAVEEEPSLSGEVEILDDSDAEYDFDSYNVDSYDNLISTKTKENNREEKGNLLEATISEKISLSEHLLEQINLSDFDEEEKEILGYLAYNLYENGYLWGSLRELLAASEEIFQISQKLKKKYPYNKNFNISLGDLAYTKESEKKKIETQNFWCPLETISNESIYTLNCLLLQLQKLDPAGVGARNLRECLLAQAEEVYSEESFEYRIIKDHWLLFTEKKYKKICRLLKTNLIDIVSAQQNIQILSPFPGDAFINKEEEYIVPDVFIMKKNSNYIVRLNDNFKKFHVNPYYRNLIKDCARKKIRQSSIESEKEISSRYVVEKVRAGEWLMKNIEQRQETIRKVVESIVKKQKKFFQFGKEYLEPMILKDVAQDIDMHESTVSRISNRKYMHTPRGVFELKYFFSSGVEQKDGAVISSLKIKEHIQKIIAQENATKPHTDSYMADKLYELEKIKVARRTIAKYREALKIPSSNRRKRI